MMSYDGSKLLQQGATNYSSVNSTVSQNSNKSYKDALLKDLKAGLHENIEVDVTLNVEPNEKEFVNVAISGINQRTYATGKTPIALAY